MFISWKCYPIGSLFIRLPHVAVLKPDFVSLCTVRAYRCTLNTVFVFYLSIPAFCYFILLLNDRGTVTSQLQDFNNRLKSCVSPLYLVKRQCYFWLVTPYQETLSRLRGLTCSQFHQRHICPLNSHLRIEAQRRKNLIFNRKVLKIHLNYE